jgi:DNA-binding NtrC family response regulator
MVSTRQATIIVIDDDPAFLEDCEKQLTAAGYYVILALTGRQSRLLIDALGETLDLALIDLVMPDENGLEIIQGFRRMAPELRMIAITERASPQEMETARYLGATATLLKPIGPDWFATIQSGLKEAPRGASMRRQA